MFNISSFQSKKSDDPSVLFVVNSEDLSHGHYNVEFAVDEFYIFMYLEKIKKRATFEVTNHFTGLMQLTQGPNSTVRENGYVSNQYETVHNIVISDKDKKLFDKAAYVRVYWFVDCLYIGMTDSLNFSNWYRNENGKYNVEALLMLSYEPLPTPTSSTTPKTTTTTSTTTTTTTTPKTTSTTTTTTTTPKTTTTTTLKTTTTTSTTTTKKPSRRKRETSAPDFQWNAKALLEGGLIKPENVAYENMTESNFIVTTTEMTMDERIKMLQDTGVPYYGVCTNDTKVIMDAKKIYGYYQRTIIVEVPVSNVTVGNNVWLKHGDMCRLQIKFIGTAPFSYCEKVLRNDNTSEVASVDDDDCNDWKKTDEKEISYKHFFAKSSNSYTLILFIKNEVALTRTTIGVQFYEGKKYRSRFLSSLIFLLFPFRPIAFSAISCYCSSCIYAHGSRFDCLWSCILCTEQKSILN